MQDGDIASEDGMDAGSSILDSEDRDRLVWIAEAGLHVGSQSAFFMWSQGALQLLLPHEILLCGVRLNPGRGSSLQFMRFSSCRYFRDEHFDRVCMPQDGLLAQLIVRWLRGTRPCFLFPGTDEAIDRQLIDSELKSVIGHGVQGPDGDTAAFFTFARVSAPCDRRTIRILDLLVPQMYVVYSRIVAGDRTDADAGVRLPQLVSQREVEILGLIKEGRTTQHIAEHLGLSPFTVKNHVQNILRKLDARTRSHAVAQAINLGLLPNW